MRLLCTLPPSDAAKCCARHQWPVWRSGDAAVDTLDGRQVWAVSDYRQKVGLQTFAAKAKWFPLVFALLLKLQKAGNSSEY